MKPSPLLLAALIPSLALVASVAVLVREEPDRRPTTEPAPVPARIGVAEPSREKAPELITRASTPIPLPPSATKPTGFTQSRRVSDSAVFGTTESKRDLPTADANPYPPDEHREEVREVARQMISRQETSRITPGSAAYPRATQLVVSQVTPLGTAPITNSAPVVATPAPKVDGAKALATAQEETKTLPAPVAIQPPPSPPAATALANPLPRKPWPRGPFTPEEELYRAQFGEGALSAALRDEALGTEKP